MLNNSYGKEVSAIGQQSAKLEQEFLSKKTQFPKGLKCNIDALIEVEYAKYAGDNGMDFDAIAKFTKDGYPSVNEEKLEKGVAAILEDYGQDGIVTLGKLKELYRDSYGDYPDRVLEELSRRGLDINGIDWESERRKAVEGLLGSSNLSWNRSSKLFTKCPRCGGIESTGGDVLQGLNDDGIMYGKAWRMCTNCGFYQMKDQSNPG